MAGGFGLGHGMAFSFVLAEMHLSTGQLVTSLLGFNLGIELVQLLRGARLAGRPPRPAQPRRPGGRQRRIPHHAAAGHPHGDGTRRHRLDRASPTRLGQYAAEGTVRLA
ncbi:UNVERIFIED_CONTAM: hypothetical protein RKD50_000683 [Streptomyces canus]